MKLQLQIELDGAEQRKGVFVIGATNRYLWFFIAILRLFILLHILLYSLSFSFSRPEVIDSALLRPGRFGNHIYIPVPSSDGRVSILKALAMHKEALARRMENRARFKLMPIDASVDLSSIARSKACENFSGADLAALVCLYSLSLFFFSFLYCLYSILRVSLGATVRFALLPKG
jgi:ribosome biogenesis ATPase